MASKRKQAEGSRDAAPAAIFIGDERHYGAVPAIGQHLELPKTARARSNKS